MAVFPCLALASPAPFPAAAVARALPKQKKNHGPGHRMIYDAYQAYADLSHQVRVLASSSNCILSHWSTMKYASPLRRMAAYYELVALAGFTHTRPDYGICEIVTGSGLSLPVQEKEVFATPFCGLRRFAREGGENDPRVLL